MNRSQKVELLTHMKTRSLVKIAQAVDQRHPSVDSPQADLVHIAGIGDVEVSDIRAELARRDEGKEEYFT